MLRKLVLALGLLLASFNVGAFDYTDAWYTLTEAGWGAFIVQSDTFQFVAFFIYDQNDNPTWYTGQLTVDASGNYGGLLYASTGSPFSSPWNPAQQHTNPVGTISFVPADLYHATLTYSITGGPTVVKQIQRFTLIPLPVNGNYSGSMAGAISGCTNPASNDAAFRGRYNLVATQVAEQSVTLTFTFVDTVHTGLVCTVTGPITHFGRLYQLAGGESSCVGPGVNTGPQAATVEALHRTGQGMEGHWTGGGGGCAVSLHFEAVLDVNN